MNALTPMPEMGSGPTMSSLEIAERTGKQHGHVMRDIKRMFEDMGILDGGLSKFGASYKNSQNKEQPCFLLPKRECLILASGYSTELRAKIIDRWLELEAKPVTPVLTIEQQLAQAVLLSQTILQQKDERIGQLETEVEEIKPLVKVAEAVVSTYGHFAYSAATLADTFGNAA
jgi:phage regulator Rha-like protein